MCPSSVRVSRQEPQADRRNASSPRENPSLRASRGRQPSSGARARCTASCRLPPRSTASLPPVGKRVRLSPTRGSFECRLAVLRRARSGLSKSALSTFRDINCRNARLCAARGSKTSGSTSSPSGKAGQQQRDRTSIPSPCSSYPIGDNLSDVAACTGAQKGPAQRQCGSFRPALRTGGGRNEARSSRARDSERAVAVHGDGIGAKARRDPQKSTILTVRRACRCSRNRRSQPTGR